MQQTFNPHCSAHHLATRLAALNVRCSFLSQHQHQPRLADTNPTASTGPRNEMCAVFLISCRMHFPVAAAGCLHFLFAPTSPFASYEHFELYWTPGQAVVLSEGAGLFSRVHEFCPKQAKPESDIWVELGEWILFRRSVQSEGTQNPTEKPFPGRINSNAVEFFFFCYLPWTCDLSCGNIGEF